MNASLAELYELTAAMSQQLIAQQEIMERLQKDLAVAHSFVENADLFWMFWGAVMVFFMQCGFALLEAGSVRTKSTANILLKVNSPEVPFNAMYIAWHSPFPVMKRGVFELNAGL